MTGQLGQNPMCRAILRLAFLDADAPSDQFGESSLFSREHATAIWAFVQKHRAGVERILVHCDAGVSRPARVRAALAKALNGDDREFFGGRYRPNMRAYRFVLEAALAE
jgi:predicted protein tyrosine phosphatase